MNPTNLADKTYACGCTHDCFCGEPRRVMGTATSRWQSATRHGPRRSDPAVVFWFLQAPKAPFRESAAARRRRPAGASCRAGLAAVRSTSDRLPYR
ncbi:hypothetical protein CTI10_001570 [Delftia acidovorans]|uniref:Uncharacterized protein n=1 Tax=Chryseobacterium sp. B5 TaxID=2050562 RepID=A0A2G7TAA4_9FLAO|nr:hypothetical protein CTI10_001570 [Delftia acidovorans]